MKFTRKLVPALILLLVSAILLTTSTFAWFSLNQTVSASRVRVKAVAPDGILISASKSGPWSASLALDTVYEGTLLPASSLNGYDFYALTGGDLNDGVGGIFHSMFDPNDTVTLDPTKHKIEKVTKMPVNKGEYGYYQDYTIYLKQLNPHNTANIVEAFVKNIEIDGVETSAEFKKCLRVSFIRHAGTPSHDSVFGIFNVGCTKVKTAVFKDAEGHTAQHYTHVGEYADGIGTGYPNMLEMQAPVVYEITIRVWFEGQDRACVNPPDKETYALKITFGAHVKPKPRQ